MFALVLADTFQQKSTAVYLMSTIHSWEDVQCALICVAVCPANHVLIQIAIKSYFQ